MKRIPRLRRPSGLVAELWPTPSLQWGSPACLFQRDISMTKQSQAWQLPSFLKDKKADVPDTPDAQPPAKMPEKSPETLTEKPPKKPEFKVPMREYKTNAGLLVPNPEIAIVTPEYELTDPDYKPAIRRKGLKMIGGLDDWWEQAGHWDKSWEYVGFGPKERVTHKSVIELCVRRAVLEALAVAQACEPGMLTERWERGDKETLMRVLSLAGKRGEDGQMEVTGDVEAVINDLRPKDNHVEEPEEESPLDGAEAERILSKLDKSWKHIRLDDPLLKFAATKRIIQLTGQVIADAKLNDIQTAGNLLAILAKPDPPTKLNEIIEQRGELTRLPNVTISARRVTPIDKDNALGRWKVMKKELAERDLPITGKGKYGPYREKFNIWGDTIPNRQRQRRR